MKNISALFLALTLSASAFAQEETTTTKTKTTTTTTEAGEERSYSFKSKNGHEVLPQCGDWGIGISATSFLNFFGGMFNNNSTVIVPTWSAANSPTAFATGNPNLGGGSILVKYMAKSDMAYRIRFQANAGGVTYRNLVAKNTLTPDPLNPAYVTDEQTNNAYVVTICPGVEFRRGSSRVQGVFGGEVLLGLSGNTTKYTYGNAFSSDFNAPTSTTDFLTGSSAPVSSRTTESKSGTQFLGGIRVFGGVEFFVAPKMSLGGEIGYTLGFSTNGEGETTTQIWNPATTSTANIKTKGYENLGLRSWGLGVDNANAAINFNFYF